MILSEFLSKFYELINPIQLIVILIFAIVVLKITFKNNFHKVLFFIALSSLLTELFSNVFILFHKNINIIYNFGFLITNSLWLYLILYLFNYKNWFFLIGIYVFFGICNMLFFEKNQLNYLTFILSSILYISIYIIELKKVLVNSQLLTRIKNELALISAPVFVFLGLSLLFSFRNSSITNAMVMNKLYLWDLIIYSINGLYYSFILIYLVKQKREDD